MSTNTTGAHNAAIGRDSMLSNTTGYSNIAMGRDSLAACTTGFDNVALGREAGAAITTAEGNTLVGYQAGNSIATGGGKTCFGNKAGKGNTSAETLFIARNDGGPNSSGVWVFGTSAGACYQGNNSSSWTTSSDERIKKDIVDSPNGLSKIDALRVRNFNYKTQSEITIDGLIECDAPGLQTGVIAQEIATVLPEAVSTRDESGTKQVNTDPVFWAMVKAIQELSAKVTALENA